MDPARCRRCGQKHYALCADVAALNRALETRKTVQVSPKPEEHALKAKLDPSPEPLQGTATPRGEASRTLTLAPDAKTRPEHAQAVSVSPQMMQTILAVRATLDAQAIPEDVIAQRRDEAIKQTVAATSEGQGLSNTRKVISSGKADTVSNVRSGNALRVARWQSAHPEKVAAKQRAYRQRKALEKAKPQ